MSRLARASTCSERMLTSRLGDGTSMNTITALLLQLIQASSHGVTARIKKLRGNASELEQGGKVGAKEEARAEVSYIVAEPCGKTDKVGTTTMPRSSRRGIPNCQSSRRILDPKIQF